MERNAEVKAGQCSCYIGYLDVTRSWYVMQGQAARPNNGRVEPAAAARSAYQRVRPPGRFHNPMPWKSKLPAHFIDLPAIPQLF